MYHIFLLVYLLHLQYLLLYLQLVHGLKCCMLKVFLYCMYIFLHIYTDIIKFSSCIFIDTYMFLDVSVIIIDILGLYYSIQAVTL